MGDVCRPRADWQRFVLLAIHLFDNNNRTVSWYAPPIGEHTLDASRVVHRVGLSKTILESCHNLPSFLIVDVTWTYFVPRML